MTVIVLLGGAATQFVPGSFVPDDSGDCEPGWFTPTNPDTKEPYTSIDEFRSDVVEYTERNESEADQFIEVRNAELRTTENGTIVQLQEVCS